MTPLSLPSQGTLGSAGTQKHLCPEVCGGPCCLLSSFAVTFVCVECVYFYLIYFGVNFLKT